MNLSPIEWTDYTANPLRYRDPAGNVVHACIHKSTGCLHCYAETLAPRWGRAGKKFNTENMKALTSFLDEAELHRMLTLKPAAGKKCFIGDMTDIFGEWVPDELLDKLFVVFAARPDVTWQILTKRPDRMLNWFMRVCLIGAPEDLFNAVKGRWPLPNVWLGVSAENQPTWDDRVETLGRIPAAVLFVSMEPMLGNYIFDSLEMLAAGGPVSTI